MSIEEIKQRVENYKSEYLPYFNNNGEMEEWNSMFKDVQFLLEQNQRLVDENARLIKDTELTNEKIAEIRRVAYQRGKDDMKEMVKELIGDIKK